jgi:hypothetical protein
MADAQGKRIAFVPSIHAGGWLAESSNQDDDDRRSSWRHGWQPRAIAVRWQTGLASTRVPGGMLLDSGLLDGGTRH